MLVVRRKQQIITHFEKMNGEQLLSSSSNEKHLKMAANPLLFLRGSASLFYADLASGILTIPNNILQKTPLTCVVGDCHISNFGFFTEEGSHGDTVVFAPNDFDDACIGHSSWDLIRMGVSLLLCAELSQEKTPSAFWHPPKGLVSTSWQQATEALTTFLSAYLQQCERSLENAKARNTAMDCFDKDSVLYPLYKKARKRGAGAKNFLSKSAIAKLIQYSPSGIGFDFSLDKLTQLSSKQYQQVQQHFSPYVDDHILDIAVRKGSGTGSLNLERYYLLVGPKGKIDESLLHLCHVVEVKQQRDAAPLAYFPQLHPNNALNPAHLTLVCQKKMQRNPDLVLDEAVWQNKHFLIRSRHHAKVGVKPEHIAFNPDSNSNNLAQYSDYCGRTLALAHSRGDRRSTRFEQACLRQLDGFESMYVGLCERYCEQVLEDYQLFKACIGR